MKLKSLSKAVGCVGLLLAASNSHSMPILDWNWTLDAGWTAAADTGGTAFTTTDPLRNQSGPVTYATGYTGDPGFSTLSWGNSTGSGQSELEILNPNAAGSFTLLETAPGSGIWEAPTQNGTEIIHRNNPITAPALGSATLSEFFVLTPDLPGPQPSVTDAPVFNIGFDETTNTTGAPEDCEYQGLDNDPPCTDVFVLENPGELTRNIQFGDYLYTFSIFEDGLASPADNGLPDGICSDLGVDGDCLTLVTNEGSDNTFRFRFDVSSRFNPQEVPAPSVLALLGLGMLGMVGYRRRSSHA